jgi:glycosyltransferase involved in cell wall biosynthesis
VTPSAPLVSIITPTYRRPQFLAQTRRWIEAQTHRNIEWLILDDSPEPCAELARSSAPDIHYEHAPKRLSIGEKRNRLVARSRGKYIAHFDDDDYYAPAYLATMVRLLEENDADFANLSSWYLYDLRYDLFGFWNLRLTTGLHYLCHADGLRMHNFTPQNNAALATNHLGFGFTYVYKKTLWEAIPFPDKDWGEDSEFVNAAVARFKVLSIADQGALVLHVLHKGSTSSCFPQYHLPSFLSAALFEPYSDCLTAFRKQGA